MVGETSDFNVEVVWEEPFCSYCGQERSGAAKMCVMCQKQMTSVVLALCKDLLYHAGQLKKLSKEDQKGKETSKDAVQELEIYRVLEHFPFEFAKRTLRFRKALETEGVWFSHVIAFRFLCHIRAEKNLAPPMIVCDPMYQMIRQQVFDFLQNEDPDEDTCEAFLNVYAIPEAEDDARSVIGEMIEELERMKRLKIARPKTLCHKCGKELDTGRLICDECEKDEALSTRLSISSNLNDPPPLVPSEPSGGSSDKSRGMHWREG